MIQPLSRADRQHIEVAFAAIQAGDVAGAVAQISQISPESGSHPDALFVASQILIAQGRLADAHRTLDALCEMAPENPHVWNALGKLLAIEGEAGASVDAYAQAAALDPRGVEHWFNLASAQIDARDFDAALEALRKAENLGSRDAKLSTLRGMAKRGLGANPAAVKEFREALDRAPDDIAARHNLAEVLRAMSQHDEALAVIGDASGMPTVSHHLRANLLADLGRFDEAIAIYDAVIDADPALADAPSALAALLPQLGREGEALDGFRRALGANADDKALLYAAIAAARDNKQSGQLCEWCNEAEKRFGADPFVAMARAIGQAMAGERGAAINGLRTLLGTLPEEAGIHAHLAPLLLAEGDWDGGERHALAASQLAPLDQSGWAWLTIAWRLKNDPREDWLADYERLVMPIDLGLSASDLETLAAALHRLHITSTHPANQSPRGGTQTNGSLFDRPQPELRALAQTIRAASAQTLAGLPRDATHPFLSRISDSIDFAGSWSIRLASRGFHTAHIHHKGWLSSAFYAELPAEIVTGAGDEGALQFGVPDETLGLDLAPRRVVQPRLGTLVLFPSYFWHGTVPFTARNPRMSVAFDALPGQGTAQ